MTHQLPQFLEPFAGAFPKEALADFQDRGLVQHGGQKNIVNFEFSGHDKGIAYRFFQHAVKNEMQSQDFDMEINDEIDMIEFIVSKNHKPVERVHMLPDQLLKFRRKKVERIVTDDTGRAHKHVEFVPVFPLEVVGGAYAEDFKRWKQGLKGLGLELTRWEKLTIGQVKTLNSEGIFTVEQFASMDPQAIERFPADLKEGFKNAVHHCNAQKPIQDIKVFADQVADAKRDAAEARSEMEKMRKLIEKLQTGPKKRGGKKGGKKGGKSCAAIEDADSELDGFDVGEDPDDAGDDVSEDETNEN